MSTAPPHCRGQLVLPAPSPPLAPAGVSQVNHGPGPSQERGDPGGVHVTRHVCPNTPPASCRLKLRLQGGTWSGQVAEGPSTAARAGLRRPPSRLFHSAIPSRAPQVLRQSHLSPEPGTSPGPGSCPPPEPRNTCEGWAPLELGTAGLRPQAEGEAHALLSGQSPAPQQGAPGDPGAPHASPPSP